MPLDTLDKRYSAHRAANPWARILPQPDGLVSQADRAHAAGFYGGLLVGDEAVLHPFGSAVGPALYEPIIGKALTE